MSEKMLKFVKIGQQSPPKRSADNRKNDFKEVYDEFISNKAKEQSSRCSQCGVPFCQVPCPLQNNIPDWLKLTAEGRLEDAYELSQSTNNMPEVCGRICPQDRLCEGNCVIEQSGHGTVTIGSVEKYITDTAWEKGCVKPIKVEKQKNQPNKKPIKTWSRKSTIIPDFVGLSFLIYNGKKFIPLTVSEDMVGNKFGEFAPTRQFFGHTPADKKAKAEETKPEEKK